MKMQVGSNLLCQPQPAEIVLEAPIRMDSRLDAEFGGTRRDCLVDPFRELFGTIFLGLRRALALAKSAERTANRADVADI